MIKRRSFLQNLVAAGLFSSIPSGWVRWFASDGHLYAEPELLLMLDNPLAVKEIGQAYLDRYPDNQNKNALIRSLDVRFGSVRSKYLKAHISQCVRDDFALGNTIQLKGWILSHSEAQQCALFSMM